MGDIYIYLYIVPWRHVVRDRFCRDQPREILEMKRGVWQRSISRRKEKVSEPNSLLFGRAAGGGESNRGPGKKGPRRASKRYAREKL